LSQGASLKPDDDGQRRQTMVNAAKQDSGTFPEQLFYQDQKQDVRPDEETKKI
jgi:hypothetical protein